jgi:hypothetical protein
MSGLGVCRPEWQFHRPEPCILSEGCLYDIPSDEEEEGEYVRRVGQLGGERAGGGVPVEHDELRVEDLLEIMIGFGRVLRICQRWHVAR